MGHLDDFLDKLQEEIFDEAKASLGEQGFDRWRNPRFNGRMNDADGKSRVRGDCGDTMEIYLKFENNRVARASYFTDGCASSQICGSFAAELTLGREPEDIAEINAEAVLGKIGTLPKEDLHCTTLAAGAVQEALNDYMKKQIGRA
ncbi:iron-sulfur cluster assembly scaffold protein [Desulfatiferula olefinivorans]